VIFTASGSKFTTFFDLKLSSDSHVRSIQPNKSNSFPIHAIRALISSTEQKITDHISASSKQNDGKMDSIVEKVEMLSAAITSVQRRLNHNLPSFSGCTQHRVLKTPPAQKSLRSEMESINPSLQDEAAERFTLDIISSVSAKTIFLYFDKVSTVDESPAIYTKLVRAIMYGLGVKMTKDTLLKGIGKAHCDFRFWLVLNVIRSFQDEGTSENSTINGFRQAVQENNYNDFSLPEDDSSVVDVNLKKILDAHV